MRESVVLDIGTGTTRIRNRLTGAFHSFPSLIAYNTHTDEPVGWGDAVTDMVGKTPADIRVCHPIKNSVVADYDRAVLMLTEFMKEARAITTFHRPNVVVSVPINISEVEGRALHDVLCDAGAKSVRMIPSVIAESAMCRSKDILHQEGRCIVDIGAGLTECAVVNCGRILVSDATQVAGDAFDRAIIQYVRDTESTIIGEQSATDIKLKIGTASLPKEVKSMTAVGRDIRTGLAKVITLSNAQIYEALKPSISTIIKQIKNTLGLLPPDMSGDILSGGLVLCGGSIQLPDLPQMIANGLGFPVRVMEQCDRTNIQGLWEICYKKLDVSEYLLSPR